MVKEDIMNDNKDPEQTVCDRNGMIAMHEQSKVIN